MKIRITLGIMFLGITSFANNAQVWTQENVSYGIGSRTTLGVSQENRIGVNEWDDGKKHLDEIHVAPSMEYLVSEWLTVGINYRHVLLRNGSDTRYVHDRRPGIDVALSGALGIFRFSIGQDSSAVFQRVSNRTFGIVICQRSHIL